MKIHPLFNCPSSSLIWIFGGFLLGCPFFVSWIWVQIVYSWICILNISCWIFYSSSVLCLFFFSYICLSLLLLRLLMQKQTKKKKKCFTFGMSEGAKWTSKEKGFSEIWSYIDAEIFSNELGYEFYPSACELVWKCWSRHWKQNVFVSTHAVINFELS